MKGNLFESQSKLNHSLTDFKNVFFIDLVYIKNLTNSDHE